MAIARVGVLGFGLMGSGIAQVCALAGYPTVVRDVSTPALERGLARLRKSVEDGVARGKMPATALDTIEKNLRTTTATDMFAECDLVIEAIVKTRSSNGPPTRPSSRSWETGPCSSPIRRRSGSPTWRR
jgi:3-hydroxybutyryl-CoA dehydrogenase